MANCPGALGFSCAPNVTQEPNVSPLILLMPPSDPMAVSYTHLLTLQYDVTDTAVAKHVLLSLCETVGARIRAAGAYVSVVQVQIVDNDFRHTSRQVTLCLLYTSRCV